MTVNATSDKSANSLLTTFLISVYFKWDPKMGMFSRCVHLDDISMFKSFTVDNCSYGCRITKNRRFISINCPVFDCACDIIVIFAVGNVNYERSGLFKFREKFMAFCAFNKCEQ